MKNEDNIKDDLHKQCKGVFCHCTNSPCDVLCRMVQSWSLHWKLDIILLAIKILKGRVITKTLVQRFINICEIPTKHYCMHAILLMFVMWSVYKELKIACQITHDNMTSSFNF